MSPFSAVRCRADAEALDAADPLAPMRERFVVPDGVRYLDGNSLGARPKGVAERVAAVITDEWGTGLIRSWNDAGWWDLPARVGAKLAPLIGAGADEVTVADSTSLNLFKVAMAALRLQPGRTEIVVEAGTFPTDLYLIDEVARLTGSAIVTVPNGADHAAIAAVVSQRTAAVCLTHVDYRTGYMHDLSAVTALVHEVGALMIWDLAHSTGAVPVDLNGADADFAVGCGYKYLNGGPGAPAHVFAARRHHPAIDQPLAGWHGHARPFAFEPSYVPAEGIARLGCGTPPVLSLAALDAALGVWDGVDLGAVRAKSLALSDLMIALTDEHLGEFDITIASPRQQSERGSQISLRHPDGGYAIMQALIARGVIGDFRSPDLLRFGFAPLYVRFVDVWDAIEALRDICGTQSWRDPLFSQRGAVT